MLLVLFSLALATVLAEEVTLDVDKDVGILESEPNANGGFNEELRIADGAHVLIKFDIDEWDYDDVTSAILRVRRADYSGSGRINAYPLASKIDEGDGENYPTIRLGTDNEDGSTWNCPHGNGDVDIGNTIRECDPDATQVEGGDYLPATSSSASWTGSSRIQFDVTDDVRNGVENWLIKFTEDTMYDCNNNCDDYVHLYSKEGSSSRYPQIDLEIDAAPETPSLVRPSPSPPFETAPQQTLQDSTLYDQSEVYNPSQIRAYHLTMSESGLEFLYSDPVAEEYTECSLEISWSRGNVEWEGLGCRFKGSGSSLAGCLKGFRGTLTSPKTDLCRSLSWKVDSNEFGHPEQKIFGLKKLQFHGMSNGLSLITERLAYEAMNEAGLKISRAVHAELYINNEYIGLYLLVEQIDSSFTKDRFPNDDRRGEGELYKEAYWNALDGAFYDTFLKEGDGRHNDMWVDFTELAESESSRQPTEVQAERFLRDHFDFDSFISYAPFPFLFSNFDNFWFVLCPNDCSEPTLDEDGNEYRSLTGDNRYRHNYYHYMLEENGETTFYLIGWDYDISFSSTGQGSGGSSSGGSGSGGSSSGGRGGRGSGGSGGSGRGEKAMKIPERSLKHNLNSTTSGTHSRNTKLLQGSCDVPDWFILEDEPGGSCDLCSWQLDVFSLGSSCDPAGELMALGLRQEYKLKMEEYADRFDNDWMETRMYDIKDQIEDYVRDDPLTTSFSDWEDAVEDAIDFYTRSGGGRDSALDSVRSI